MQETWVLFLGWEDLLEKGMAMQSSILPCRIPQTEEPGGLQSMGSQRVRHNWTTNTCTFFFKDADDSWGDACSLCGKKWKLGMNWNIKHKLKNEFIKCVYSYYGNGTHSSTLAWKIPWTEEPGRLQSMGSLRVGHDWSDLAAAASFLLLIFPLEHLHSILTAASFTTTRQFSYTSSHSSHSEAEAEGTGRNWETRVV